MNESDPRRILLDIAKILDDLRLPYLITGGMAVFIWGRPRFTADIDLVIELAPNKVENLERALKELYKSGYIDREAMQDAVAGHGEFNFIDGNTGMKVDFWVSTGDAFDVSRMKRRIARDIQNYRVHFSAPEDLILSKLRWYADSRSSRHLEDIDSVLHFSAKEIDYEYLKIWAKKLGYSEILEAALKKQTKED